MSIISTIKDFFKKPEVSGVLLTCATVVVGAVYDGVKAKAKTNADTDSKEDKTDNENKFKDRIKDGFYKELEDAFENARALRTKRLNNPDVFVYMQLAGAIVGISSQLIGFIFNNNKEDK